MSTRLLAHVDDEGRLVLQHPERTRRYVGRAVWISLHDEPAVGLRSEKANKYLWGVVYRTICEETGNDPESIHYGLKREAIRQGILEPEYILLGDHLIEADPTTRTDPDTFSRYVTWVKHIAVHELGIVVPESEA